MKNLKEMKSVSLPFSSTLFALLTASFDWLENAGRALGKANFGGELMLGRAAANVNFEGELISGRALGKENLGGELNAGRALELLADESDSFAGVAAFAGLTLYSLPSDSMNSVLPVASSGITVPAESAEIIGGKGNHTDVDANRAGHYWTSSICNKGLYIPHWTNGLRFDVLQLRSDFPQRLRGKGIGTLNGGAGFQAGGATLGWREGKRSGLVPFEH